VIKQEKPLDITDEWYPAESISKSWESPAFSTNEVKTVSAFGEWQLFPGQTNTTLFFAEFTILIHEY
jgi:hypothetical protein